MLDPDFLQPQDGLTDQERELKRRTEAATAASAPLTEALDRVKRYSDPATNPELNAIVHPKVGKLRGILATIAGGAAGMMADSRFGQNALDGAMRVGEAIATPGAQGRRDRYTATLEGLKTSADVEGRKAQIAQQNHQIASGDTKAASEANEAGARANYYNSGSDLHRAQAKAATEKSDTIVLDNDKRLVGGLTTNNPRVIVDAAPPKKRYSTHVLDPDSTGAVRVATTEEGSGAVTYGTAPGKFPPKHTQTSETAGVLNFMADKDYNEAWGAALQRNGNDPVAAIKDPGLPSKYVGRATQEMQKDPMFSVNMMSDRRKNKPKPEKPSSPGFISRIKEWAGLGGGDKPMPTRPEAATDTVKVKSSDGRMLAVPRANLDRARQIDPGLKVID